MFYYYDKKKKIKSFKKSSTKTQTTVLVSVSHAAETNVCCSLGSAMGLTGSPVAAHAWVSPVADPLSHSPDQQPQHTETTTQKIREESLSSGLGGRLTVPARGK